MNKIVSYNRVIRARESSAPSHDKNEEIVCLSWYGYKVNIIYILTASHMLPPVLTDKVLI